MGDSLAVDGKALKKKISNLSAALKKMENGGTERFTDDLTNLGNMNTDFIAKLKPMIENIDSDYSKKMKRINNDISNANKIVEELEKADSKMASKMKDGD